MLQYKQYVAKGGFMYGIKRNAFAMLLAIFVVILVALGGVMLLGNAATGSSSMGNTYLHAQAELLATSATEFAVMRAQGVNTAAGSCLNAMNITVEDSEGNPSYDVNMSIQYSFSGNAPAACNTLISNTGNSTMMFIDTTVSTHADANLSAEPIRVHKRTWQKL